ncbi:unnamed protein product [Mytilus edulis]|uniref:Uncharacterized protein n=1 Tax=Mytilus edulis TaxID=6550 RepID=A0A8S3UQ89_MYTED|nr:unnamed protein product [Mytilus edulis]
MAAAKKNGFDIILSSFKSKCSDLLESDSTFHESITAVNEHLQTESAETTGMTGEDKVAVKVITLMLPALEVLITTKQDDRLNKHDVAINKLQAQVRNVLYENDSLNQYSRRENVRISNVPEADGEDLTNILIEIAGSVGVVIKPDNINAIHRIGPKREGKARQVIARFVHREPRFLLLKNRAELRKNERFKNIFIAEDLTKLKFKLLFYIKKQTNVKSAFTKEGRIHCTLNNDSKVTIDSPDDLFKIGMDTVDYKALGLPEF